MSVHANKPDQTEVDAALDAFADRWRHEGYHHPYIQVASQLRRWITKRLNAGRAMEAIDNAVTAAKRRRHRGKK